MRLREERHLLRACVVCTRLLFVLCDRASRARHRWGPYVHATITICIATYSATTTAAAAALQRTEYSVKKKELQWLFSCTDRLTVSKIVQRQRREHTHIIKKVVDEIALLPVINGRSKTGGGEKEKLAAGARNPNVSGVRTPFLKYPLYQVTRLWSLSLVYLWFDCTCSAIHFEHCTCIY